MKSGGKVQTQLDAIRNKLFQTFSPVLVCKFL